MIKRRTALSAPVLTLAGLAAPSSAFGRELSNEQVEIVRAFYTAANSNNWAFIAKIFADNAECVTNANEWFEWVDSDPELEARGAMYGARNNRRCVGPDEIYGYFRHRQFQKGWRWSLEKGPASIFSPEDGKVIAFAKMSRDNGECWGPGVLCMEMQPTFIHVFDFTVEVDQDIVLSNQVIELFEINLQEMRVG